MTVFYSEYSNIVEGRSIVDLSSANLAELKAQAQEYNGTVTYSKGDLILSQGGIWVYVNDIASSGHTPPTLPTVSNVYWELLGIVATNTFTWIAYANSQDGTTFTDFTLAQSNESGITRKWIGIAVNQVSAVESTNTADYSWTKFVGEDGEPGTSAEAPILATITREAVLVPTDSNGENANLIGTGSEIRVYQGTQVLLYDAAATGNGYWKINTVSIDPVGSVNNPAVTDSGDFATIPDFSTISSTADKVTVTYNITGKTLAGVPFGISKVKTLTKAKGAIIDTTPPTSISTINVSTSLVTLSGGELQSKISASWSSSNASDFSYYEVEIKQTSQLDSAYINFQTASTSYEWIVPPNISHTIRVRPVDKSDNKGSYTVSSAIVSASGTVDHAGLINSGTTFINANKIVIDGPTSTYLSNWRNGSDQSKIEGGSIAANTVTANKMNIGIRGVDISGIQFQAQASTANQVTWSSGKITYINDSNTVVEVAISAGSANWTSGVLYIYWVKNDTTPITTLASSTATGTAYGPDKIVLATYAGGVDLVANYGRTVIDGSQITTGTVLADRLKANSVITSNLYVGSANAVKINGAAQGTGKGAITVSSGALDMLTLGYIDSATVGFRLKSATSGERMEITEQAIKVYDASGTLRVKLGNLA